MHSNLACPYLIGGILMITFLDQIGCQQSPSMCYSTAAADSVSKRHLCTKLNSKLSRVSYLEFMNSAWYWLADYFLRVNSFSLRITIRGRSWHNDGHDTNYPEESQRLQRLIPRWMNSMCHGKSWHNDRHDTNYPEVSQRQEWLIVNK